MKKTYVDCLIIIEHTSRELESACLLKYEFEKRGYTVAVEGIYPNKEMLALKYKAKYIIVPWAYHNNDMNYWRCFLKNSPDAVFLNMHHEQYTPSKNIDVILVHDDAKKMYHVSWGKHFSEKMIENGCQENTIFDVGNIRLDPFKKELTKIISTKQQLAEKYGINPDKKWALYIADGAHIIESYRYKITADEIAKRPSVKCRKEFLEYVDEYLNEHDDYVFIYRPHPNFSNKDYNSTDIKEMISKHPNNFYIISDGAINSWIKNCDINYSFQSTTFVECYMCNSHYYLFRTAGNPNVDYRFFDNYKYKINNHEEFLKSLDGETYNNDDLKKALKDYYDLSNDYTFEKIVDVLLTLKPNLLELKPTFKMLAKNTFKAYAKNLMYITSKIGFINKIYTGRQDNRIMRIIGIHDDLLTKEKLNESYDRIKKALN